MTTVRPLCLFSPLIRQSRTHRGIYVQRVAGRCYAHATPVLVDNGRVLARVYRGAARQALWPKSGRLSELRTIASRSERSREVQDQEKVDIHQPSVKPARQPLKVSTKALREKVRARLSSLTPHENIYNLPNILTFSRLLAAPAIGYFVLHDLHALAVGLFAYAGITDLIDGWIARRWKLQTVVGSVVDPMADKMLMTILVGCLAVKGTLPLWLATIILGRDTSLGLAAIYYRWASLPSPKTLSRYWDFSLPSASVHPTPISKFNTFLQLILIGSTTALPLVSGSTTGFEAIDKVIVAAGGAEGIVRILQYTVASTTLWSGASYVWNRDAVKILSQDEALKRKQGRRGRAIIGISFAAFVTLAVWLAQRELKPEVDLVKEVPD